jgi:hypothetical protein
MKIPAIKGIIDRRILINFTVDPEIMARLVPPPFRPKVYLGKAIVGICLIRLRKIRPKGLPGLISLSSENAAHRIAVEWTEDGITKEGVYIPRRDTSSKINSLVGGRIFPGRHHHAEFEVHEQDGHYQVAFRSSDGTTLAIKAEKTPAFNPDSIFQTLDNASRFFQGGAVGYSPGGQVFEGLELRTDQWKVESLSVSQVQSSFFEDEAVFPKGSIQFDNALLMTGIEHEWHSGKQISMRPDLVGSI